MPYPYADNYNPMTEMFLENGGTATVESKLLENGDPSVILNDHALTEDEVQVLVRHLLVNLEHARWLYFERRRNPIERKIVALVEDD